MVDRAELEGSLKAVRQAHAVLEAFHREVVAFLHIVDEQLGEDGHGAALTAFDPNNVVWASTSSVKRVAEWTPSTIGRLYYDEALDVEEGADETSDSMSAAMVSVTVGDSNGLAECWFGFGRPGAGTKATGTWNFARHGLWKYNMETPPTGAWVDGTFTGNAWYGTGGIWHVSRVSLLDLTNEDQVRELVARPLLTRWKEVMRGLG
jgi:hypothetical protein